MPRHTPTGLLTISVLALCGATSACAQSAAPERGDNRSVIAIQSTPVVLVGHAVRGREDADPRTVALNVHDDENTSVEAALSLSRTGCDLGVRLVEIQHSGARNLTVHDGQGDSVTVDPNRMFTDRGARVSMERLGRFDPAAFRAVRAFADTLLARAGLDTARVVVTLHNNTDANYSIRSYLRGGSDAAEAADVHLDPTLDPDDFFFVTDRPAFDALAARGFNVVLQDNARATDDGSLSVLAARRGQRYVNVEAQHGHVETQAQMLCTLLDVLDSLPPL